MRKKQFTTGIIAILVSMTITAHAQVPVQWTRTLQLEGNWSGAATLVLGGQAFIVDYHTDFKTGIDGNVLTMEERFSDINIGDFKGANLIGYSPYDDNIHWFSADNFGTAHEHTGSWLNPKHFYMEHHSVQGGLDFVEYIDLRLRANNQKVALKVIATLGPDTVQTITGTLFRQNCRMVNTDTEAENYVTIYPNPADGIIHITHPEIMDEITITNEAGQLVYQANPNETDFSLELNEAGIYFVQIMSEENLITKKIFISKK